MAKAEAGSEEEMMMNRKDLAQLAYQGWKTHTTGVMVQGEEPPHCGKKSIPSEPSISGSIRSLSFL